MNNEPHTARDLVGGLLENLKDAELIYTWGGVELDGGATVMHGFATVLAGWHGGFHPSFMQDTIDSICEDRDEAWLAKSGTTLDAAFEMKHPFYEDVCEFEQSYMSDADEDKVTYTARAEPTEDGIDVSIECNYAEGAYGATFTNEELNTMTIYEVDKRLDAILDGLLQGAGGGYRLHREIG